MPNFIIPDASERPTVTVNGSRAQVYSPGGLNTIPQITVGSQKTVTLTVTVTQGKGTLVSTAAGVSGSGTKTITVQGTAAAVTEAIIDYDSPEDDSGEILFEVKVSDGSQEAGMCDQHGIKLVPGDLPAEDRGAEATVTLYGTNGSTIITVNGEAIGYGVEFTGNLNTTAAAVVEDINNTTTTPDYTAELISGSTFKIKAPVATGEEGNGLSVGILTDGDMNLEGDTELSGGAEAPFSFGDFWNDYLEKPLIGLGAAIGGQVISNMLFPNAGQINIKLPEIYTNPDGSGSGSDPEQQFDIAFLYKGRVVRVPAGYDGENRVAPASWDYVSFDERWTDNPVWCALDYLENKRYGCGNLFKMTAAQRTALYKKCWEVSQWCDGRVDNGLGGTEPRFSFNMPLAGLSKIETLQSIASSFHGQFVFPSTGPQLVVDMPAEPVILVNRANVAQGGLVFRGSGLQSLYNLVNAGWQSPAKYYRREYAFAEDRASIESHGQRAIDVIAVGATTARQAIAHARWILETDKADPLVVSYKAGWDHYNVKAGDLIRVYDPKIIRNPVNNGGGRIVSATSDTVTFDRPVEISGYPILHVTMPTGEISTHSITTYDTQTNTAWVHPQLPMLPERLAIYVVGEGMQFKITSINRERQGVYSVTAVYHDPSKYARIDDGAVTGIGNATPKSWSAGPSVSNNTTAVATANITDVMVTRIGDTRALATYLDRNTAIRNAMIVEVAGDRVVTGPITSIQAGGNDAFRSSAAVLNSAQAIMAVNQDGTLQVTILDVGASSVSASAVHQIATGDDGTPTCAPLGGNRFLICTNGASQRTVRLYQVTGTDITMLDEEVVPGSTLQNMQVVGLSATEAALVYGGAGGLIAQKVTAADNTISLGVAQVVDSGTTNMSRMRLTKITADTIVMGYRQSSTSPDNGINIVRVGDGGINATGYVSAADGGGHMFAVPANPGVGEVLLLNRRNDGSVSRRLLTIDYTTINSYTLGDVTVIRSGNFYQIGACRLSNSKALMLNGDGASVYLDLINR